MKVPAYGHSMGRALLFFVVVLAVLAGAAAFVVLPGSRHVVESVGDCSPPLGSTCVPPQRTVLVGDGYAGIRAAVASGVLLVVLVARHLILRAKRRRPVGADPTEP